MDREGEKRGGWRSACLGRKGDFGSGWSVSLKGTGYPDDRVRQDDYNYNTYTTEVNLVAHTWRWAPGVGASEHDLPGPSDIETSTT